MSEQADIAVETDVIFAPGPRPLRWDIYRPAVKAPGSPVTLVYHGGGFRVGDRGGMAEACTAFAGHGWTAIAAEYRLLGEAPWPAPLDDTRTAVAAVHDRAEALGVDASHLTVTGYSAGAHLALIAGATMRDQVAGVAAFFPPVRMPPEQAAQMLGVSDPTGLAAISPLAQAGSLPPTILFCGDEDSMTPAEQTLELYRAIRAAGGTADLRLYAHLVHEFVRLPGMMDLTIDGAVEFFSRTILNKPAFDASLQELRQWWVEILGAQPGAAS